VQNAATQASAHPAFEHQAATEASLLAVIICEPETAGLKIAGLPILDRLIVAAHRAGAKALVIVSSKPLPRLPRTTALNIGLRLVSEMPDINEPTLILSTRLLVQPADLKALMQNHGRLVGRDGTALPAGVLCEPLITALDKQLSYLPAVVAQGVAEPVTNVSSAASASHALWASLTSASDGFVDKHFNRPVGRFLFSKLLVHTPVSPNQVSIAATLLGLWAAWLFALGHYHAAIWGAILLQVSAIVDCVDGDLARVLFKESPLGKWLDIVGDQIVHIGVFAAIALGLYRAGSEAPVLLLGASAIVGVVISFLVVLRALRQPESRRNTRLQKLIDATTNRDFSVLLILLALLARLEWFLWMTAIGVHVFWMAALAVQVAGHSAAGRLKAHRESSA
jgi:phosphatidylglycerophosphate synthase